MLCIADLVSAQEVQTIVQSLSDLTFVDGATTAGGQARQVKHNTQAQENSQGTLGSLQALVVRALSRNPLVQIAAYPRRIRPPLFSRYEAGMSYGTHVDNALMGGADPIRTDLSLTLFLSDPDGYQGGELVIESTQGEQWFKLPAGAGILYPSAYLHRVEGVTAGIRLVAVTWLQSWIRDPAHREILFDLQTVQKTLLERSGKTPELDLLAKTQANLLRQWMDG